MTIVIIIVFILILGLLIFSHELGHFLVARRNGIKAEEFGFGFPPRILGFLRDKNKWQCIWGNKEINSENTVYSINWIPMGGFVKIKGENGEDKNEKNSFASKKPWIRVKVLAAGVIMNFILAWFLYSVGFIIGNPEAIENGESVQIVNVVEKSPAFSMGLKPGDEIMKIQVLPDNSAVQINKIEDVQNYIGNFKGQEVNLKIKRGNEILNLKGVPRVNAPDGQGHLGIELAQVSIVKYPWYQAPWMGLMKLKEVFAAIFIVLFGALKSLFIWKAPVGLEIAGPVKIFNMTGDFVRLGYIYVIQFAALLSVNLGIINALPFPALDGGRILFIIIEKIKGRPVKEKIEQAFHTVGFFILIMLMVFIITRELLETFWK